MSCTTSEVPRVASELRGLKERHGLKRHVEAKWVRVSPSQLDYFLDLVKYFFESEYLNARILLAPKGDLRHEEFGQDHDTWYYKMYYQLLLPIVKSGSTLRIFLDIKDTKSVRKERKLREVLSNTIRDFDRERVPILHSVRSHEVEIMQLLDVLIGALNYRARGLDTSDAKLTLVREVERLFGRSIESTTPLHVRKLNLFYWQPQ